MKLNLNVNSDSNINSLVNPIYEQKTISILTKFLIRLVDIIGAIVGIIILIPLSIYVLINRIKIGEKNGPLFYTQKE